MSTEEEEERDMTEAQVVEDEAEVEVVDEIAPEGFMGELDEDDGEEEEQVGWYVKLLSDPDQIHIVKHPEGKTHKEVFEAYVKAKQKKQAIFVLAPRVGLDPEDISVFGWSQDIDLPVMEAFDSVQERMEFCAEALGDLTRQQAALQEAQASLITGELEELQAERADRAESGSSAIEPEVLDDDGPIEQPAKKGFRPPGA
jgi:hypothetical protein